jgi:alkylhydroperoxidase family enzyme
MADCERFRQVVVDRVLSGDGTASPEQRRAAYDNHTPALAEPVRALIDKVARHAYRVTDEDVAAAKAAGASEDQLFELCVCAAIGQSMRQLAAAHGAIAAAEHGRSAPTTGSL